MTTEAIARDLRRRIFQYVGPKLQTVHLNDYTGSRLLDQIMRSQQRRHEAPGHAFSWQGGSICVSTDGYLYFNSVEGRNHLVPDTDTDHDSRLELADPNCCFKLQEALGWDLGFREQR